MDFTAARKELEQIKSDVAVVFWKEAGYWANSADDYQTKYAFSRDYDKSYKHNTYDRAEYYREVARTFGDIPLPETGEELADCIKALMTQMGYYRESPRIKDKLTPLSERLERLSSQC